MKSNFVIILMLSLLTSSCINYNANNYSKNRATLLPDGFFLFINNPENGLIKDTNFSSWSLKLLYKPLEFETLSSLPANFLKRDFDSVKKEKEGYLYFTLSLLEKNNSGNTFSSEISRYLSYLPNDKILFCTSKDTTACVTSHYISPFFANEPHKLLIVFKQNIPQDDFKIFFKNEWQNLGQVNFEFRKEVLKNIPALKIQG